MFECRSCVLRSLEAIAGQKVITNQLRRTSLILTPRLAGPCTIRKLSTTASRSDRAENSILEDSTNAETNDARLTKSHQRALRLELRYLQDPLKFANHVHYLLRDEKPEKALELCRIASKDMECTVAWNHTIDWHVQRGKHNEAHRIYNEMKKRAQFPDSYTYMLLLRGIPQSHSHYAQGERQESATKAVSLYNSMSAPTSRVKPNIKHTNAVLRACSVAKDMDSLWSVVGKLPSTGASAPDHITYTIILGALRYQAFSQDGMVNVEQMTALRQDAVNEGRRIWLEVIERWRKGEITIDDSLVIEMANLLLMSKRMEDWDDVLNLIAQTTRVPRQVPALGKEGRSTQHVPVEADVTQQTTAQPDSEGWVPTPASNAFKEVKTMIPNPDRPRRQTELVWVLPSNGILNSLMIACNRMRVPKAVYAYWDVFTKTHNVEPDLANYHTIMTVMRTNRNSAKAVGLLQSMYQTKVELRNMTFRLAMSVCSRDIKNHNIMEHATALVELMAKALSAPDFQALTVYLSIAMTTRNAIPALEIMWPMVDGHVRSIPRSATKNVTEESIASDASEKDDAVTLYKSMIGAIDNLIIQKRLPSVNVGTWRARRYYLDKLVGDISNRIHRRRDEHFQKTRVVARYADSKKNLQNRRAEMVKLGLRKPPLSMSAEAWEVKKAALSAAKARRKSASTPVEV